MASHSKCMLVMTKKTSLFKKLLGKASHFKNDSLFSKNTSLFAKMTRFSF